VEARLRAEEPNDPDLIYWLITLRHGIHTGRALLAWCAEALSMLDGQGQ
jgi:hypothetical protein